MTCLLFGGSFDPPHWGHVFAVCKAAATGEFERIIIEPVYQHPYDKALTDYEHRREMCELAFGWLPSVTVNGREALLHRELGRRIYTYDVVASMLNVMGPGAELSLLVGQDAANDLPNWHRADELMAIVKIVSVPRGDGVMPNISSSEIRWRLHGGAPDPGRNIPVAKMLPPAVLQYIHEHNLYTVKRTATIAREL
jgi:nicotinate-nucleotide adenylyltransferase